MRLETSENRPMTDASLAELGIAVPRDAAFSLILDAADQALNRALAPFFAQLPGFGGYLPEDPATGLYRPVAECGLDIGASLRSPMPCPSGLGDLCADALRAVPNAILAQSPLLDDPTPFTAAALATGELRGGLDLRAPISFADLYGLLGLGLSPDPAQAGAGGEPLISVYMDVDGLRELCAMQLLLQTGLGDPDYYLNLSGLAYGLLDEETGAFFATASAAQALALTGRRAQHGSAPAVRAILALEAMPHDQGAALQAAMAAGNPYAGAMVRLGDPDPDPGRIAANLALLGQVAAAAARDAATGTTEVEALLMAKARAAVGEVRAFDPADPACTGPAATLGPGRVRIALDLYALLGFEHAQSMFGLHTALYRAPQGDDRLSGATPAGLKAILANRIGTAPGGSFLELKDWMAVLSYLATPAAKGGHFQEGRITREYGSSADYRRFPAFGAAVQTRNADYPLDRITALADQAAALRRAS